MELKAAIMMEEEKEEGELSDEELDDVSSSSIPVIVMSGKSPVPREPFKELSLTSISDISDDDSILDRKSPPQTKQDRRIRYHMNDTRPLKRKKRRKSPEQITYFSSSSSESDVYYIKKSKKVLKQLQDAVRISSSKKCPNRSLSSRIKLMMQPETKESKSDSISDDDGELEELRNQALQSKVKSNIIDKKDTSISDKDLIQLRLDALQSAMLKKHQKRRKRKEEAQNESPKPEETNDVKSTGESSAKENCTTEEKQPMMEKNPEEDEDILRAMLLTSISKKIANNNAIESVKKTIMSKVNTPVKSKSVPIKCLAKKPTPFKNSTNCKPAAHKNSNSKLVPIKNSIICKPALVNRLIINLNSDTDSEEEEPVKKTEKIRQSFDQKVNQFLKQARARSEIEKQKDISKHLPQQQQEEYRYLKRKLQQMSKKDLNEKRKPKLENGSRLNMQGKYVQLTPLMTKVTKAQSNREKAQAEVQRLLNELKTARAKLTKAHNTYSILMNSLVKKKAEIDKKTNNVATTPSAPEPKRISLKIGLADKPDCDISNVIKDPEKQPAEIVKDVSDPSPPPSNPANNANNVTSKVMPDIVFNYESPLDHILNRESVKGNPLDILCPFELQGECRDEECSYRHLFPK